jgi:YidC/Oxa1 family membrane protein insertase
MPNTVVTDLPEAMARVHQLMPVLSALGLAIAGGVVPVALLVYWVCNSAWTLGESAVVWRWFPTPGSPAAGRLRRS